MKMSKEKKDKYIKDRKCPKCGGECLDKGRFVEESKYFISHDVICISCGWEGKEIYRLVDIIGH